MQSEKGSLSKWLVKSENKILGPYTFDQIEDLIRKKQISIIDEVRDTATRWLYVRENPEFKQIVEYIRNELDSKSESTKTYQSFSKTGELLKTKTDISSSFTDVEMDVKDVSIVKEILQNQVELNSNQDESVRKEKVKLYGLEKDNKIKVNVEESSNKFLIYVSGLFLVIILSTVGFFIFQKYNQQRQEELLTLQIKKYKFLGLDNKAVEVFGRMPSENQKKMIPQMIELFPLLESNGLIQMSEIENLKNNTQLNIEQRMNLQLVNFWFSMQSQKFDLAQEYIVKASTLQPGSVLVKENDAIVQIKKGRFQKALDIYNELYKTEASGRYLMGQVISWLGLSESEKAKFTLQISEQIEKYSIVNYEYKKELLLAQLLFSKIQKNDNLFLITWKQFINTPCQLSTLFKKPLLLAPHIYYWSDINQIVELLKPNLNSEEAFVLEMHNLIESAQISAANQHFMQANAKLKNNFLKQQLNMLLLHFQSRTSDILALEKSNQLEVQSELNQVILALNKIEQDPQSDLSPQMQYFNDNHLNFYSDWISLNKLVKQKSIEPLRMFTRNHFLTVNNFIPAIEAKSLVE